MSEADPKASAWVPPAAHPKEAARMLRFLRDAARDDGEPARYHPHAQESPCTASCAWVHPDGSIRPGYGKDACPGCGVEDLEAPCLGSTGTADGVRRPLPYRHAGRPPPPSQQPRLDGPALTAGGSWDTETLRRTP